MRDDLARKWRRSLETWDEVGEQCRYESEHRCCCRHLLPQTWLEARHWAWRELESSFHSMWSCDPQRSTLSVKTNQEKHSLQRNNARKLVCPSWVLILSTGGRNPLWICGPGQAPGWGQCLNAVICKVKESVLKTVSPHHRRQMPATSPGCPLCFWPTNYKLEAPMIPFLGSVICWSGSWNSGKQFTY